MKVKFSQAVFDEVCDRIADGNSLRSVCKADDMPSASGVLKWLANDEKGHLVEQYTRARELQADMLFDDCLDIADQYDQKDEEDNAPEHVNRARLRIDTRKWMAGKLRPKKYSDKLVVGGDKDLDPIQTEEKGKGVEKLTNALEKLAQRSGTDGGSAAE